MTRFDRVRITGTEIAHDTASDTSVLHVSNHYALIQAVGYLKYVLAKDSDKNVSYRGQTQCHAGLPPSLFRHIRSRVAWDKCIETLKELVVHTRGISGLLTAFPAQMTEPLLQHYGIRTSWID